MCPRNRSTPLDFSRRTSACLRIATPKTFGVAWHRIQNPATPWKSWRASPKQGMWPVFIIITTDIFILNNNFLLFIPNQFQYSKEQGKVSIPFLFEGLFSHSENRSGFNHNR
jgi:hypothetical protein